MRRPPCRDRSALPYSSFRRLGKPRRMEEAERPARVRAREIGPDVEQELGQVPVFGEVRPQRADGAMVARPEGTGLTRTALGTSHRVCELAGTWLHAPSVAPTPTRTFGGGAGRSLRLTGQSCSFRRGCARRRLSRSALPRRAWREPGRPGRHSRPCGPFAPACRRRARPSGSGV